MDIKAKGFWRRGQTALFHVRVAHVNADSYKRLESKTVFEVHEKEKKINYIQRVLEIKHGTFTPLVFGTNGGMGKEA